MQGEWKFSIFHIQTLQRPGNEGANGNVNPGVEDKVWDGQLGLHREAINEASIVHFRADHDTVKSKYLQPVSVPRPTILKS